MKFVASEKLKPGMRLAKPIYNRTGVLLYDRNTKLNRQGIVSIKNFKLIGVYILEPAEPLPPMTEEDIAFERFQTIGVFSLRDAMSAIVDEGNIRPMERLADEILRRYANHPGKTDLEIHTAYLDSLTGTFEQIEAYTDKKLS